MTQQTLGAPPATAPTPFMDYDDAEPTGGNRRKLVMAAGGLALVLVAGGGWFLMHGSSSSDSLPPVIHHAAGKTATSGGGTTTPAVVLPKTVAEPLGKDPFKALYVPAAAGAPVPTDSTSSTTSTSTTPTTAPSTGSTRPGSSSRSSGTPTTAGVSGTPTSITLTKLSGSTARFHVTYTSGSDDFTVTVSKSDEKPKFGSATTGMPNFFQVTTLVDQSEADVQYGDSSPVPLHLGQVHILN